MKLIKRRESLMGKKVLPWVVGTSHKSKEKVVHLFPILPMLLSLRHLSLTSMTFLIVYMCTLCTSRVYLYISSSSVYCFIPKLKLASQQLQKSKYSKRITRSWPCQKILSRASCEVPPPIIQPLNIVPNGPNLFLPSYICIFL